MSKEPTRKSKRSTLKAMLVPVYRVHYEDLEEYIKEVFGFEYDFLFATGFVHGMCPEYQVGGLFLQRWPNKFKTFSEVSEPATSI